jgi:hypothetical protein
MQDRSDDRFYQSLQVPPVPAVPAGTDPYSMEAHRAAELVRDLAGPMPLRFDAPREPLAIEGQVVVVPAALMTCMQSSCSGRQEGRPATVVACYPSGERCPSCDECARYWLGLRPDATWIEPLESYRDPLEQARASGTAPPAPAMACHVMPAPSPKPAPGHADRGWNMRNVASWTGAAVASVAGGIALIIAGRQQAFDISSASNPSYGLIIWGVLLILLPFLAGAIAVIVMIAKDGRERHASWLAQFPPEQQGAIRRAEKAALWAGAAVGAVALHEHNKRTRQATIAAGQVNRADYAAQRRHRELIDAIQSQQPSAVDEQTAATQRLLARSAANRNNRGWS